MYLRKIHFLSEGESARVGLYLGAGERSGWDEETALYLSCQLLHDLYLSPEEKS